MKCPKCGTVNGKTNRFCRQCGFNIEALVQHEAHLAEQTVCAPDDVALGEELFAVWTLYEAGALAEALDKVLRIIECNLGSASAHSIAGLIYERRAQMELSAGNTDAELELLEQAIAQYERILSFNPDSAADKEKLTSLRAQVTRRTGPALVESMPALHIYAKKQVGFKQALVMAPKPYLAAFGGLVVFLMIGIIFLPGGEKKPVEVVPRASDEHPQELRIISTPRTPEVPRSSPKAGWNPAPDLKFYTFPAPSQPARPSAGGSVSAQSPRKSGQTAEPLKLPDIGSAELTIVPESKKSAKKPADESASNGKPASIEQTPSPKSSNQPDGASLLAAAIRFHDQGSASEAVQTAEQAITRFQEDLDAGRNEVSAKRGIENARKLIAVWRQTSVSSSEEQEQL